MGFNRGDKVIDISGAVAKVTFVDPGRKIVAIKIIDDLDGLCVMREGHEYSVPERQVKMWSSKAEEQVKKKRGFFRRKK